MKPMATRRSFMFARIALRRWLRNRSDRQMKRALGWRTGWESAGRIEQ